jgi:tetratricopeptide (TPR) repeat protein
LLILDGVEPLQYAPTAPTSGELKDQGIAAMLKGLAATSHGLTVVTTRYAIPDLRNFQQTTAPMHELKRLSTPAGVALLKALGVKGNQQEFETLTEDVKGHALALNLFGSYLRDAHGGDIRKRDLVKLTEADAEEQGGHAFRVMDAYALAFEREGEKGQRALALLRLLGLVDRPADAGCLAALLQPPAIPNLTEALAGISEAQRNLTLTRLESAKLLTVNRDAAGTLLSLDAHPLLREYFAGQLRERRHEAWHAGHRRLYEHLCASTPDKPDTLEGLQPLYQAVAHGCQAGLQQEACDKVYYARILRGAEHYSWHKLGTFGSELGAQACFFDVPWSCVSLVLTEAAQAWLLNEAANSLRALGRVTEAVEPMRAGLEMRIKQENWKEAALNASNLSELELTLGEVAGAMADAKQSVTYADRSGDVFWRLSTRTAHADTLHQAGRRAEAEARFRGTERMQTEGQPYYPLLYSLQGFQYCDLLLTSAERGAWLSLLGSKPDAAAQPEQPAAAGMAGHSFQNLRMVTATGVASCDAVAERAARTLIWAEQSNGGSLLDIALYHLTLGRAALYGAVLECDSSRIATALTSPSSPLLLSAEAQHALTAAATPLNAAVDGLHRAGMQDHLPRGLLSRAWLRTLTGATTTAAHGPDSAHSDLDEAWEIAERGPMPLFMADIHLYRARLFFGVTPYPWVSPRDDLAKARALIERCGYWRRKEELEDAEAAILGGS